MEGSIERLDETFLTNAKFKKDVQFLARKTDIAALTQKVEKCASDERTKRNLDRLEEVINKTN